MSQIHPNSMFDVYSKILRGVRESIDIYTAFSSSEKLIEASFSSGRCFEQLFVLLEMSPTNRETEFPYRSEIIKTFTALLQQNDRFKVDLAKNDGYARLCIAILDKESPLSIQTFDALFGMLVDSDNWDSTPQRIANKYTIAILMDLFSIMEPKLQLLLMDRMTMLASTCDINCWVLCNSSIISKILRSPIPTEVSHEYVMKTMCLFEILGSYSVTISDVKLLLSSLCFDRAEEEADSLNAKSSEKQVTSSSYLTSYHSSLLEVLYEISQHNNDMSFFQFKGKHSGIQIHHFRFPSSGYSFFSWIKLDNSIFSKTNETYQSQTLISFTDNSGNAFIAYFDQGTLIFRILSPGKDETITTKYKFSLGRWYFITIIHTSPRFSWGFGQSDLLVYVDGDLCLQNQLDYPSFHSTSFRTFIGASSSENSPRLEPGARIGGENLVNSFHGKIATIYLLRGSLTNSQVFSIYKLGKEHASIFSSDENRGVQTASSPITSLPQEISQEFKVIFVFHARASSGTVCYNLYSYQSSAALKPDIRAHLHATLTRIEKCSTLSLQNALHALGGIENLFPLLLKLDTIENIPALQASVDLQTNFFIRKGPVPAFFALITSLIKDHQENQHSFFLSNGVHIISFLLKQIQPVHLSVPSYQSIVSLSNVVQEYEALSSQVYLHLLFNIKLWMYSSFETQAYILDLIKNMIDSRRTFFRSEFNIPFFFDILRVCYYYEPDLYSMPAKHNLYDVFRPSLQAELFQLRSIILDIIQSYLKDDKSSEGALCLSRHLLNSKDYQHSVEILNLTLDMFRSDYETPLLKHFLYSKGYETLCYLLQKPNNSLRAIVYETLAFFIAHPKIPERWKVRMQAADIHTSVFARSCSGAFDFSVYTSMLRFCLHLPKDASKHYRSEVGLMAIIDNEDKRKVTVRNPTFLVTLLHILTIPDTPEDLKELVLSDFITLCSHSNKLCQQLQLMDGFLIALLPLLPIPQDRKQSFGVSSDKPNLSHFGMARSSRLVIELLCTIAVATMGHDSYHHLGSNFIQEVVYHWWSSSTIFCRQAGISFHRDHFRGTDLRLTPHEVQPHAFTLSLLRQFLAHLCSRIESFISEQEFHAKSFNMDKWIENMFNVQSTIDVILFHHWELEESVFGRLVGPRPKSNHGAESISSPDQIDVQFKRLSDPGLNLLESIPIEDQVHQLPNNPWEESLELTVPFLSLLTQLDLLFGNDRYRSQTERRTNFYNNIYKSTVHSPCLTMIRILSSGFEVPDINTLHMVKSHLAIFFERHSRFTISSVEKKSEYTCPFSHNLFDFIPTLFGYIHEAFLAMLPTLENQDNNDKTHPIVHMYQYIIKICWDILPDLISIPDDVLKDFWSRLDHNNSEFVQLATSSFWVDLCHKFFLPAVKKTVEKGFIRFSHNANAISQGVNSLIVKTRREILESSRDESRFHGIIQNAISSFISYESKRVANIEVERKSMFNRMHRLWIVKLQELSREHSVSELQSDLTTHWKLDFIENYSRMRRRLTINHEFTNHQEASAKRDKTSIKKTVDFPWKPHWKRSSINHYLSRANSRVERLKERLSHLEQSNTSDSNDIDSLLSTDSSEESEWNLIINDDMAGPTVESPKEKALCEVDCCLIFLLASIHGRLRLTPNHLTFFIDRQRILEEINTPHSTVTIDWDTIRDRRWKLNDLREVHFRKHMLRKSALEFFFTDRSGFFFNFPLVTDRQKIHTHICGMSLPNLIGSYASAPSEMLRKSNLTRRWQRHEISNFDYLMQLNSIAGRTYNDLTQYFVFPWILNDYESDILDLDDPTVYRDLSKPIGALDPKRLRQCIERYKEFEDPTGRVKKFHYGTHYSSAGAVAFYLLRLEPFTSIHIALQSGKFDHADRQFRSIQSCWESCLKGLGDVKELIPEFFYLPEFLKNSSQFDLGKTQEGKIVDEVGLPPWADSPEHFVRLHREALESEYVSQNLHHWIDLIFGFKQTGEPAIQAHNTFYYLTYEGAVDLDTITDPIEKRSIEEQIYHFGQTPTQLMTSPHPQRFPRPVDSIPPHMYDNDPHRWKIGPSGYKTYLLKLPSKSFVFLSVCDTNKEVNSSTPSNNYHIITVDITGTLGYHKLHINSQRNGAEDQPPFTMETSHGYHESHRIASPFAHHARISPKSFIVSSDGQYIISTGHWDNTFKVVQTNSGKIISSIGGHGDLVTCCAVSEDNKIFISGSRSSNVFSWSLDDVVPTSTISALAKKSHSRLRSISTDGGKSPRSNTPGFLRSSSIYDTFSHNNQLLAFYGHNDAVVCLAVNAEHDILVSGSKDGSCIIHSLRQGLYLRSLVPHGSTQFSTNTAVIQNVLITSEALIIICSEFQNVHHLHVYTINGTLLHNVELDNMIKDVKVSPDQHFIFLVNSAAQVLVYHIFSMEQVLALDIPLVAQCLFFDPILQIFFLGCSDGKLLVIDLNLV